MFYLKYRTSKPIIDLAILLFVGILLMTGCGQQSTSPADEPEIEEPTCEKDGIVSLVLTETIVDSTDDYSHNIIDTVFVSETEDSVWIRNAVPFSLPQSGSITMFFQGPLQDMPNYAAVWYSFYFKDINGKRIQTSEFELIQHNHGLTTVISSTTEINKQDSLRGFAFLLDFDNAHAGSGELSFESGNFKRTLYLQSENHTVLLDSDLKIFDFETNKNTIRLRVESYDADSFINLQYDVIWLLQYTTQTDSFHTWANSKMGTACYTERTDREFRLTAFAPNFITDRIF